MSSKALIVKGDKVSGQDQHNVVVTVSGNPSTAPLPYKWEGPVRAEKAPFFTIGGKAVVTVSDQADLDPDHHVESPVGGPPPHDTMAFSVPPDKHANPNAGSGSKFFKAAGTYVVLDGDKFDGCGNAVAASGNLSVKSSQGFFTVKE